MAAISELSEYVIEATSRTLLNCLDRYLPDNEYRGYFKWALSEENPHGGLFRRNIALTQLGNLTAEMLQNLPGPGSWSTLIAHAVPVNVYQIFEVISDNLGLGLAGKSSDESVDQRSLLLAFNTVAATDLKDPTTVPAAELLAHLKDTSAHFSGFVLSLTEKYQHVTAEEYENRTGLATAESLQLNIWSGLVANIESGRDVLVAIGETCTESHVRAKTIERYEAVNQTLTSGSMSREELVSNSRRAILVTPTLGYFASVFGEVLNSDPGYLRALDDGSLMAALDTASLLVRLQNDIGTGLLGMRDADRSDLFASLAKEICNYSSAIELVSRAARHPRLNRFRKDIANGEFNICLYDVYKVDDVGDGLSILLDNLQYFGNMYSHQIVALRQHLDKLGRQLHDRRIIEVTRRFVRFHQNLYSYPYDTLAGDYAI
jgi:hypothetical protein